MTPALVPSLGLLGAKFERIRSIAVLRGGGLGDLLFIVPALVSLATAYPQAEITLLGTPVHASLLKDRPGPVTRVDVLPAAEGVYRPAAGEPAAEAGARDRFFARQRERGFDLALQLHGGGRFSNPFLQQLGARHTVGCRTPEAPALERSLDYVYYQHAVLRSLEVASLAGAAATMLEPTIEVTAAERNSAAALVASETKGLVTMHPGATDPRRRWPAGHFSDVAARLAAEGYQVLVVGDGAEEALAAGVAEAACSAAAGAARERIGSVAGRLDLGALAGLLACSDLFIGNDSGPRHLAQAVGAPTVSVYWCGNALSAGPLSSARHRLQLSWTTRCPVCGVDVTQVGWTAERCEHDDSFVAEVQPGPVYADAVALLAGLGP